MFDITQLSLIQRGFNRVQYREHMKESWWEHPTHNLRITLNEKPKAIKLRMKSCSCNIVMTPNYNLKRLDAFLEGLEMTPATD